MSARSAETSPSRHTRAARSTGSTRASRAKSAGSGLSAALVGLKQELLKPGRRPALFGGAVFAAYMTLLFASIAVWRGLSNAIDQSWAAVVVMAVWAAVCAALYVASRRPAGTRP